MGIWSIIRLSGTLNQVVPLLWGAFMLTQPMLFFEISAPLYLWGFFIILDVTKNDTILYSKAFYRTIA